MAKYLVIVLVLVGAIAQGAPSQFDQKFNQLEKDFKTDQVKSLLGGPDLREVKGGQEIWHYNTEGGRKVVFENGKVKEFGKEDVVPALTSPVEVLAKDLDYGQTCKNDDQCKSKNCHFHTCSGKNNCSVPVGGLCATNADCCGGKCDFQKCKNL